MQQAFCNVISVSNLGPACYGNIAKCTENCHTPATGWIQTSEPSVVTTELPAPATTVQQSIGASILLQDVLENDDIKLDKLFKSSLISDLANVSHHQQFFLT